MEWHRHFISLRNSHSVLKTGQWQPLNSSPDLLAYIRKIEGGRDVFGEVSQDNTALVLLNRNVAQYMEIELSEDKLGSRLVDACTGDILKPVQGRYRFSLKPLEGKLYLQSINNTNDRESGILLHPTSLPSKHGIGDFGDSAYAFVDFLCSAGQKLWQILPLNPVSYGESPYQCLSAFAGNPLLISPEKLIMQGLLTAAELKEANREDFLQDKVDFEAVKKYKEKLFRKAFKKFVARPKPQNYSGFTDENEAWLSDYVLFIALKMHFGNKAWNYWEDKVSYSDTLKKAYYQNLLQEEIDYQTFLQYAFWIQWQDLKKYANKQGVKIIGDIPIFVAYDSSDVWANPELFELDEQGNPAKLAGVPPDYFSETGQVWGNPHYKYSEMAKDDYAWWCSRFRHLLRMTDIVRVDHFRGFDSYWEIPAGEKTAINGKWIKLSDRNFFAKIEKQVGKMPLIAEDLGIITPEVEALKRQCGFPGMKVLHFTLDHSDFGFDPYNYSSATVVYTGTHDNDTTLGWYRMLSQHSPGLAAHIAGKLQITREFTEEQICWRFIEFAYKTRAKTVIIPLQDVLGLGTEARMNYPGTVGGNWDWRCRLENLQPAIAVKLKQLAERFQR